MTRPPYLIIAGTREVVQSYRERMYSLSTVQFDLNEIGETTTNLLHDTDRYALWKIQHQETYEDIAVQLSEETDESLKIRLVENLHEHTCFGDAMQQLYSIFTRMGLYQINGTMKYAFHHWLDDDMVLCLIDDSSSYDISTHRL